MLLAKMNLTLVLFIINNYIINYYKKNMDVT